MISEVEMQVLACALKGDVPAMISGGFRSNLFVSVQAAKLWEEIHSFWVKHGEIINKTRLLENVKADYPFDPPEVQSKWSVYAEQLIKQHSAKKLVSINDLIIDSRKKDEPILPTVETIVKRCNNIKEMHSAMQESPVLLSDMMDYLEKDYEDRKKQSETGILTGIPMPFKELDDIFMGMQNGDLTVVAGRPEVGKSWMLLMFLVHAAKMGYNVSFASCEMDKDMVTRRLGSLFGMYSASRYKKGKLSPEEEIVFKTTTDTLRGDLGKRVKLIPFTSFRGIDDIARISKEFNSKLVCVDSFYRIEGPGDDTWKQVQGITRQIKNATLMEPWHWIITSQLNKQARTIRSANTFAGAFSDAILQECSNYMIMFQSGSDLNTGGTPEMVVKIGKIRDGERPPGPLRFKWDLKQMIFEFKEFDDIAEEEEGV